MLPFKINRNYAFITIEQCENEQYVMPEHQMNMQKATCETLSYRKSTVPFVCELAYYSF